MNYDDEGDWAGLEPWTGVDWVAVAILVIVLSLIGAYIYCGIAL